MVQTNHHRASIITIEELTRCCLILSQDLNRGANIPQSRFGHENTGDTNEIGVRIIKPGKLWAHLAQPRLGKLIETLLCITKPPNHHSSSLFYPLSTPSPQPPVMQPNIALLEHIESPVSHHWHALYACCTLLHDLSIVTCICLQCESER